MDLIVAYVPHTGWAWEVAVAVEPLRVVRRVRRVAVEPVEDAQLYHLAAESADPAAFLAAAEAKAAQATRLAVDAVLAEALASGDTVRAAVVVGKTARLAALDKIVAAHPLIHGAEGELWRRLFAEALAAAGIATVRVPGRPAGPADAAFLAEGKRTVGAPWSAEQHQAALAAADLAAGTAE